MRDRDGGDHGDGFWDRNHRFRYLVARENARRIRQEPDLLQIGLAHLERFARDDPHQAAGYQLWRALLAQGAEAVAARLEARTPEGEYARDTAPSFGALPAPLRAALVRRSKCPVEVPTAQQDAAVGG